MQEYDKKNYFEMSKRKKIGDVELQLFPNPKHTKFSTNHAELLDGIGFMDFDDEFGASSSTGEPSTNNTNPTESPLHGLDFNSFQENEQDDYLDLTTWKRCIIDNCQRDTRTHDLIIIGYEDGTKCDISQKTETVANKKMKCHLQQFWSQCRIEAGDIVSILAVWNNNLQSYCVTNTDGLVVVRPDFLVSGTTTVSGLFCMRKAVLQERFKGIEAGLKIVSDCKMIQIDMRSNLKN